MASETAPGSPKHERVTDSGITIKQVYGPDDLSDWDPDSELGTPGSYPYTRGIRPDMYRGRLWTMRQYAGFGTAEATNERFKFLLDAGQTGLSCAFDLPTQMGYDSDHPRSEGEVGKVGVAIDSLEDMRALLSGLPLDKVTTSMTINATAAILLLFYQLVAEEDGVGPEGARRDHPERHPEGVRGPGHIHLPSPPVDATGDIVLLLRSNTCRRGTPSPSPATTSARPVPRRSRRSPSPWPTGSPTSMRRWPPASRSTTSPPGLASSGTRTTTCSKKWPSTVPRAGCGRRS